MLLKWLSCATSPDCSLVTYKLDTSTKTSRGSHNNAIVSCAQLLRPKSSQPVRKLTKGRCCGSPFMPCIATQSHRSSRSTDVHVIGQVFYRPYVSSFTCNSGTENLTGPGTKSDSSSTDDLRILLEYGRLSFVFRTADSCSSRSPMRYIRQMIKKKGDYETGATYV